MSRSLNSLAALFVIALALPALAQTKPAAHKPFGFGTAATQEQIAGWNIDVRGPDGAGLPPGKGTVAEGEQLFMDQCSACHGEFAERSEQHTSELQSLMRLSYAVFCLKTKTTNIITA